jgi:hypothetical protein
MVAGKVINPPGQEGILPSQGDGTTSSAALWCHYVAHTKVRATAYSQVTATRSRTLNLEPGTSPVPLPSRGQPR